MDLGEPKSPYRLTRWECQSTCHKLLHRTDKGVQGGWAIASRCYMSELFMCLGVSLQIGIDNSRDILSAVTHAIRSSICRFDASSDAKGRDECGIHGSRAASRGTPRSSRSRGGRVCSGGGRCYHRDKGVGFEATTATAVIEAASTMPLGKNGKSWEYDGQDADKSGTHVCLPVEINVLPRGLSGWTRKVKKLQFEMRGRT